MKENFGNGWVDRGPRIKVKYWDDDMRGSKAHRGIDQRILGYSELALPIGLVPDLEELLYGDAAPHLLDKEQDDGS